MTHSGTQGETAALTERRPSARTALKPPSFGGRLPRHLGVIVDGNRRWARAVGASTVDGHTRGAEKIREMLGWCEELGIEHVTVWMLSTDNLSRHPDELVALFGIIEDTVERVVAAGFDVQLAGCTDVLPDPTRERIETVLAGSHGTRAVQVNLAIGYGGRREIVDGVRSLVQDLAASGLSAQEIAEQITVERLGERLYTAGQPDPDLVIRTSGEQRTSGFLLWQSVHTELWFTSTHWPAFEKTEFLEALADFCRRDRRFGS